MDGFWTCPDCGSANPYPQVKECEVCGKILGPSEIKQAEKSLHDAKKSQSKIKREEIKQLREKKIIEKNQKRNEKMLIKRQVHQEFLANREKKYSQRILMGQRKEQKFFAVFNKILKAAKAIMIILVISSIIVVSVSIFRQNNIQCIEKQIMSTYDKTVTEFIDVHFYKNESDEYEFNSTKNIERQYKSIKKHFRKSKNIKNLFDILGW